MTLFHALGLFCKLRRAQDPAKPAPARSRPQHTLLDTLMAALIARDLDPEFVYWMGTSFVQVLTVDGSAVTVSDTRGEWLDVPLSTYQGLVAYRHPLYYDPGHPSDYRPDPGERREVYATKEPVEGDVRAALEDLDRLVDALAMEATRPLPDAKAADLLQAALDREGLQAGLSYLGGEGADGVEVRLGDDTHMLITDPGGTQITYPAAEHEGLLVNRYFNHDISEWRMVYESHRSDAVRDVQAAVAVIVAEAGRPLTDMVAAPANTEPIAGLGEQFEQVDDTPVVAVLLSLLRGQGWECSLRALSSGGPGVHIPMDDGTHVLITDPIGCGLSGTVRDHRWGVLVARVSEDVQYHHEVYDSRYTGIQIHDTFSAIADLMQAIAAIGANDLDPFWL